MPCKLHFPGCFATWLLPVKSLPIGVTSDDQMVGQGVALSPIIAFSFLVILGSVSTVVMSPPPQSQGWTVAVLSPPQSSVQFSCSVVPGSLRPHGLQPTRLLRPWHSPGKDTGVGCHFLLLGIFPAQGSNPGLLYCKQILYQLGHKTSYKGVVMVGAKISLRLRPGEKVRL